MVARRALLALGTLSALAAAAGAWLGELVLVAAFAVAALVAWLLAGLQRRGRTDNVDAAIERALAGLDELQASGQAARKPLSAWVVAGTHLGRLAELGKQVDARQRGIAVEAILSLADATFNGPKGRRNVTYDVVARILDAFEAAAPLTPASESLHESLSEHLWVDLPAAADLHPTIGRLRGGLRPGEGGKSFDPPVFKRRVNAMR